MTQEEKTAEEEAKNTETQGTKQLTEEETAAQASKETNEEIDYEAEYKTLVKRASGKDSAYTKLQKENEKLKVDSMSQQEKAIHDAEEEIRTEYQIKLDQKDLKIKARDWIALEKLPPEAVSLISGTTEEEIKESILAIKALVGKSKLEEASRGVTSAIKEEDDANDSDEEAMAKIFSKLTK